jgi:hypothetical protein
MIAADLDDQDDQRDQGQDNEEDWPNGLAPLLFIARASLFLGINVMIKGGWHGVSPLNWV